MTTRTLARLNENMPTLFDNFFKPWDEWFQDENSFGRVLNMPAVNIMEHQNEYEVSLAVPGLKKEDFKLSVDGNLLTISSEKKEENEEKNKHFTRKEYNYSSFSRTFTLPEEINKEKIEANYKDGVLSISLPRLKEAKEKETKQIPVK